MELFKNTRLIIARKVLKNRYSRSKRKMVYNNFSSVRTIGIVWDASNHKQFQSLARFHQKMHEKNINVKIIGLYEGKDLPDQYTAQRYLTCIRKPDLNFLYIPNPADVKSFINFKFDILIDINFEKQFSLKYVTTLSNASFKTGLYDAGDKDTPFDLMMEMKKPVNIDDYLSQVIQYLEMINS